MVVDGAYAPGEAVDGRVDHLEDPAESTWSMEMSFWRSALGGGSPGPDQARHPSSRDLGQRGQVLHRQDAVPALELPGLFGLEIRSSVCGPGPPQAAARRRESQR